jgi:DNA-binding transcriptional LysR family regulator
VVERLRVLEQKLRARPDVVAGNVRLATVYSVGLHTLPPALKKFLRAHPQVNVRLEYRRTDQVYEGVLAGEIDLGIVALPARRPQLEVVALRPDQLLIVFPPEHPLARRRPSLRALAGQPFIAFDRDIPTRKLIDRLLRGHGVSVTPVMELDNIETIKRSVEAGLGLSILPAPALSNEVRARTLVARPPAEGPLDRAIGVIFRRGRELPVAAGALLALLKKELGP